jgi:hypothetical protein
MKVKLPKVKLHNEFNIIVKDSKTGEIEKEIKAYNTVLTDSMINYLADDGTHDLTRLNGVHQIHIGRGTGTPASTDTALFDKIAEIDCTREEYQLEKTLSSATFKATIGELEHVGEIITELGLETSVYWESSTHLITHALLKDSEGNPISIGPKTNTQIIEIYATVYIQANASMGNDFIRYDSNFYNKAIIGSTTPLQKKTVSYIPMGISKPVTHTFNDVTKKSTFLADRMQSIEGNDKGDIVGISLDDFGYIVFPNTTFFPTMSFTDKSIGTGDGSNKYFSFESSYFKPDTEVIKVNEVIKVKNSDYYLYQGSNQSIGFNTIQLPYTSGILEAYMDNNPTEKIEIDSNGNLTPNAEHWKTNNLIIDFKGFFMIKSVFLQQSGDYNMYNTVIEGSIDNTNWFTIVDDLYLDDNNGGTANFDPVKVKYLKIHSNDTRGDVLDISKIEVMGGANIEFTTPPGLVEGEAVGTGDGTTVAFDLDHTPLSIDTVYLDGVETTAYASDGATITFDTAPTTDVVITADYKWAAPITASWDTDVPPKSDKYSYDVELEVDWS